MRTKIKKRVLDNLFIGSDLEITNRLINVLRKIAIDDSLDNWNENEMLVRKSVKVVKNLYGNDTDLQSLFTLATNNAGKGLEMISDLKRIGFASKLSGEQIKENNDLASWFVDDYYTGAAGQRGHTNTFEKTSWTRNNLEKLLEIYKIQIEKGLKKNKKD